jgi:hypothetical protein
MVGLKITSIGKPMIRAVVSRTLSAKGPLGNSPTNTRDTVAPEASPASRPTSAWFHTRFDSLFVIRWRHQRIHARNSGPVSGMSRSARSRSTSASRSSLPSGNVTIRVIRC